MPTTKKDKPFESGDSPTGGKARELNRTFSDLNRKFEEQETQRRAKIFSLPYFDLFGFPISQAALRAISEGEAKQAGIIPFFREKETVKIGIVDPNSPDLGSVLKRLAGKNFKPETYLISQSALTESLKQYNKILPEPKVVKSEISVSTGEEQVQSFRGLLNRGAGLPRLSATEFLDLVVGSAITMRASDIHFEPEDNLLKVRFRIDGVLQELLELPKNLWPKFISRIKLISGLKLNLTTSPQDGRTTALVNKDYNVDLRISVLPTAYGESAVIRLLGLGELSLQMEDLGISERLIKIFKKELGRRNGMILTTGPTGSGKTTTLYTFLNFLNKPGTKIVTIEDPVEYQLEGVVQTPIDKKKGVDFASSLRAIIRQDPDVIMVGEIRDEDTAETAAQAALTGHMVLSTMHTNDAAGAIPRFLDFGVKPVTLAPALNALIAQRLLRRICEHCKEPYKPKSDELERVKQALAQIPSTSGVDVPEKLVFYHSLGCNECHQLGYLGRVGIFEAFSVDEKIEQLIYNQASSPEIKKAVVEQGMLTLQQDALLKAVEGVTDLAEVWRITEE